MANIALTSRYGRRQEMLAVASHLESIGHKITSRWLHSAVEEDTPELAAMCLNDVAAADVVVAFTDPPGAPGSERGGRHVEFGAGAILGKRLVVVGRSEHLFHHLERAEIVDSTADLVAMMKENT